MSDQIEYKGYEIELEEKEATGEWKYYLSLDGDYLGDSHVFYSCREAALDDAKFDVDQEIEQEEIEYQNTLDRMGVE